MGTKSPIVDIDIEIHIKRKHAKEDVAIWPEFTNFEYTIKDNTNYTQETNETLWQVVGRFERVLFKDRSSKVVCSPDIILFDLSGHLSLTQIEYKIEVTYDTSKRIEIQNVRFFDYGRIFEEGCHAIEEIYFTGTMDYKNIAK